MGDGGDRLDWGVTALLAALMAVQQDDIKRILAYSTLSQLGYMVMVVGLGGETNNDYYKITNVAGTDAAMFHLTTHAFFKAMLFLGAGSVIYACHHNRTFGKWAVCATECRRLTGHF